MLSQTRRAAGRIVRLTFFVFPFSCAVHAFAAPATEHVQQTVPFPAGGTVTVKNDTGDIRITGADRPDVAVAAVRRGTRERLDRVRLRIATTATGVSIDATKRPTDPDERGHVVHTEFVIQVPRHASVAVSSFSSAVDIQRVTGALDIRTHSGDIRVAAHRALKVHTFSGGIETTLVDRLFGGDVNIETHGGDVQIRMPRAFAAGFTFDSPRGQIDSDLFMVVRGTGRGPLRGIVSPRAGDPVVRCQMRVKTFSGNVRITQ